MLKYNKSYVSIIMNCHNGAEYLKKSVKSVINQTYKNWELIFFNNCSSDNSLKIINSFNDTRIKIFNSNKFLNLYHARNEAIKKARGSYICFLDTDDYWKKKKLELQVNFLEKNRDYGMVYSKYYIIDKNNNIKHISNNKNLPEGRITKSIIYKYSIGILTAFVRKNIFKKNLFNKNFNIIGDFDFFVRVSTMYKIGCIQEPLAYYRIHEDGFSKKKIDIYIDELNFWITKNNEYFSKRKISLNSLKFYLLKLRFKYFLKKLGM